MLKFKPKKRQSECENNYNPYEGKLMFIDILIKIEKDGKYIKFEAKQED